MAAPVELRFVAGTLELRGWPESANGLPPSWSFDPRAACHRAPASSYAETVLALTRAGVAVQDSARAYQALVLVPRVARTARPYQTEALSAWRAAGARGVVVLPTGAGKTWLAMMAIADRQRSTLVVTPTLDLVRQWHDVLAETFAVPIGVVRGGEYSIEPLTVTTYDSAYLHMDRLGARFGLVVFDECHHLPGPTYALAARMCLAPLRLGLTATPERPDGRDADLTGLVGPTVFRKDIVELEGTYLADYDTVRITVDLEPEERAAYTEARALYVGFLSEQGISMGRPDGWTTFIMRAARSAAGQRALAAYRKQRELAFTAPAKLQVLERLLQRHRHDRALVFTQDNATCYLVSRRFLIPAITHHTKTRERAEILAGLADGSYGAVVTSKVLNEGVDIPDANVAVVLSGSGSVREHVQRLGRILRKRDGKRALLYEVVTGATSEASTSERRRDHVAYR